MTDRELYEMLTRIWQLCRNALLSMPSENPVYLTQRARLMEQEELITEMLLALDLRIKIKGGH